MKKMYNVIFPIFFLFLFPMSWLIILPANFLIDLLVFYLSMRHQKIENRKELLFPAVWKVWGFGFLSDIIGCLVLLVFYLISSYLPVFNSITQGIVWNPYGNFIAFLLTAGSVVLAGYLIYLFNKKYSFRKTMMSEREKHVTALYLAVFTAPYVLLIPTMWLYPKM